jgi:RHS repeat-associated protein
VTADGQRTFEWDAENRLVAINQGTYRSEFTYNGNGERVRIVERNGGAVLSDQRYVWCERAICEERDSTGSSVTRRFYSLGVQEGGTPYFHTTDHLGSIREMTDSAGSLRARYEYDPYGRTTQVGGDKTAVFGFTGLLIHSPSGLAFAKWRAYDAVLGRWLSEDPIGLVGGINFYAYVSNDPADNTDRSGLAMSKCARRSNFPLSFTSHVYVCNPDSGRQCGLNGDPECLVPLYECRAVVIIPEINTTEPTCKTKGGVVCVDVQANQQQENDFFTCCENPAPHICPSCLMIAATNM